MKKYILFFVLLALSSPSWALRCIKDYRGDGLGGVIVAIPDEVTGPFNDDYLCRRAGYFKAADEQTVSHDPPLTPDFSLTQKNNVSVWLNSIDQKAMKDCDPTLPPTQLDFYKSLRSITGRMNCNNVKTASGKKLSLDTVFFDDQTLSKVEACTCMVQEGPPPKISKAFEKEQLQRISNYITEEYIGNLAPSRIYQYSLQGSILPANSVKACDDLVMDIQVQNFVKENLEQFAPEAKMIFGKMTAEDALTIYNKTQKPDKKLKAVPTISQESFTKFGAYWANAITKANAAKSYSKLKENLCSLTSAERGEQFEVDLHDQSQFDLIVAEDKTTAPTTIEESVERAFMDKMLCSRIGSSGTLLIDELNKKVFESLNSPKKPEIAFMEGFTKIVSSDINNRCRKSEEHIGQLSKGSMAAILNDDNLVKELFGNNIKSRESSQRYYCQMMKKQLKSNPEYFLEQFCNYKMGEPLPPNRCVSIGDFINTTFVYEAEASSNGEADADQGRVVSTIVDNLKRDGKVKDSIQRKMNDVHVEHATTLSDLTKRAKNFMGPTRDGKVRIDLNNFTAPDYNEATFRTPVSQEAKKNTRVAEVKEQAAPSTVAQRNNVLPNSDMAKLNATNNPMAANTQEQIQGQVQSPVSQPAITYENRNTIISSPTVVTQTPAPSAAQVVASSTTSLEKKAKTPKLFSNKTVKSENESDESDEEEIITEVKKVSASSKDSSKKDASKSNTLTFSGSKGSSNTTSNSSRVPTFQEASRNPSFIPEEAVRSYAEAKHFDKSFSQRKTDSDTRHEDFKDPSPPDTGIMLSAFRTGKIGNKSLTKVTIGDEIKDLKSFENTNTYHGPVVIVEDKAKNERYICRAIINDNKDGGEKFIGLDATAPKASEMAGYKCTNEVLAKDKVKTASESIGTVEKQEALKVLSTNERMYKAFVLDKIIKSTNK